MSFSKRYGYKKINEALLKESMPEQLNTRIWNIFHQYVFRIYHTRDYSKFSDPVTDFIPVLWDQFLKRDIEFLDENRFHPGVISNKIKKLFYQLSWNEVYDFAEFYAQYCPQELKTKTFLLQKINSILEDERAPYRIVNNMVTPLISEEEIEEIERALNLPDKFESVRDHLEKALKFFSNREEPDYANSIKESMSGLESLVQTLLGEKGTLGKLIEDLDVHPALKKGFSSLYGWTSDEGGIRHGKFNELIEPQFAEARYMLVTISAFINFIVERLGGNLSKDSTK